MGRRVDLHAVNRLRAAAGMPPVAASAKAQRRARLQRRLAEIRGFAAPATGPGMIALPYPPTTNHLYATVRGNRVKSEEARVYKDVAGDLLRRHRVTPIGGPVVVRVDVYRPRRQGDLDGRLKALLDALTGYAYADDEQVAEIHARRFEDRENPRVEVSVQPVAEAARGGAAAAGA